MLVNETWLQKVQNAVFSSDGTTKTLGAASLFYDIRPAVLASDWLQNAAGLYAATANFLVNDAVDSSFTFPVYAPTATSAPGGAAGSTRFFVVWRGRWEMMGGENPKLDVKNTEVVSAVSVKTRVMPTYDMSALLPYSPSGKVVLTVKDDAGADGVPVVTAIECANGALVVTTQYLSATFESENTMSYYPITGSAAVVSGITATSTNVVSEIDSE